MVSCIVGAIIWVIWAIRKHHSWDGLFPFDIFSFLAFVTDRQILILPGGHYEFYHQTLQDHFFADMWEEEYINAVHES